MVLGNWNTNYLQLTIYAPIKLTSTLEGDFIIKSTKVRFEHNVSQLYAKAITINCIRWSGPKAIAYNSRFRIFQTRTRCNIRELQISERVRLETVPANYQI